MEKTKNKNKIKFYGNGLVWNHKKNKMLCKFINGLYETDDCEEIDILRNDGFQFEGKLEVEIDEKKEQIKDLTLEVESLKANNDPEALEKIKKQLDEIQSKNLEMETDIKKYKRAADIITEKAVELGFEKPEDLKKMDIITLCEAFVSNIEVDPDNKS